MSTAVEWIDAIGGAGAGAFAGVVVKKVFDRRKDKAAADKVEAEGTKLDADAAQVIANTAVALVAPLQSQITLLTSRVETLESENATTRTQLHIALEYIRELHAWIRIHIPGKKPPRPPKGLEIDWPTGGTHG